MNNAGEMFRWEFSEILIKSSYTAHNQVLLRIHLNSFKQHQRKIWLEIWQGSTCRWIKKFLLELLNKLTQRKCHINVMCSKLKCQVDIALRCQRTETFIISNSLWQSISTDTSKYQPLANFCAKTYLQIFLSYKVLWVFIISWISLLNCIEICN